MVIDLTEEQIDETAATALSPKSRNLQDELYAHRYKMSCGLLYNLISMNALPHPHPHLELDHGM